MRIFKMLPLMLIGLYFPSTAQEEAVNVTNEQSEQEQIKEPAQELTAEQSQPIQPQTEVKDEVKNNENAELSTKPQVIEIPAVPEPTVEEASTVTETTVLQSPVGIDTVSLEEAQGNWLFKRIWWERAEERYEKIRILVDAIWRSRTEFFIKRNDLDRNVLDPFYINIGMRIGELQVILTEQIDSLEKQREQEGSLNEEERESFESLIEEQESLKQLKMDIDSIANLDHAIDNALDKLMQQINNARNLETQAWKNFKEIAHILNDTKARELYYMIEGAARNIKNISTYLEQSFLRHFDNLIYETRNHIAKVQQRMLVLKEKGVTFKSVAEQIALQEKEEQEQREAEAAEQEEEESKPKPKTGLINWIITSIKKLLKSIVNIIKLPYTIFFGK